MLLTQWEKRPLVRLDSPPGAGKTFLVECLAAQSLELIRERCMVVTQTNEQAIDLARRLARGFPRLRFTLFLRKDMAVPKDIREVENVGVLYDSRNLPEGPSVVVANAEKWAYFDGPNLSFDVQIVDEAFQLPEYRFAQIAGLAKRIVLVGDPGQIAPVITCNVDRWRNDPLGPHLPCPEVLSARRPDVLKLILPATRRLPPDSVHVIQRAFYPNLPFASCCRDEDRTLSCEISGYTPLDVPINRLLQGASLVLAELKPKITGIVDEELADLIAALIGRAIRRRVRANDGGPMRELEPGDIGVVCAHVAQVSAVQERLPGGYSDVLVETSDRFQGLERSLVIVHHPLSGRVDASRFHLDSGRLCVMMSRHRNACVLVSRGGTRDMLMSHAPAGERVLGLPEDREYQGWHSHLFVLDELRRMDRIVRLSGSSVAGE